MAAEKTPLVAKKHDVKKEKAPPQAICLRLTPKAWHPYLELIRLDKPNGLWIVNFPFLVGLTFGAYRVSLPLNEYLYNIPQMVIIATLIRSSCCAINDIVDRDLDAGVERTKNRPMASGRLSVDAGYTYTFLLWFAGAVFTYIFWGDNLLVVQIILFQMIPMFWLYPYMKRITYWPQLWLGPCCHLGMAAAFIKASGQVDLPMLTLHIIGGTCHSVLSDTIYACQDKEFDLKVGVKSTAILFGEWITPILFCFGTAIVALLAVVGYMNNQTWIYFVFTVGGVALEFLHQAWVLDLTNPKSCRANFMRNGQIGWFVSSGIVLDYLVKIGALKF